MENVLQGEVLAHFEQYFKGPPGIRRFAANIEEDRSFVAEHLADGLAPLPHPAHVVLPCHGLFVAFIAGAQIVGWRSYHYID